MRILHVIEGLDPRHGGPPEIAASLAASQAAIDGVSVSLIHQRDAGDETGSSVRRLIDHIPGFERVALTALPAPAGGRLRRLFAAGADRALLDLVQRHDVVHLHNVWDGLLVRAARACRRAGVPYVILINGMLDTWSLAQRSVRKRIAMATTHRALLRGAAAYQCGNDYERDVVGRLRLGPQSFIVPNGLWLSRVDEAANATPFRTAHPELRDDPFVLFLSRLHHKKGLDFLMGAFERIASTRPTLRLVVAGPDGGELAFVNEQKARSAASDRIHVVGPLYGPDKFAALAQATCFCLPSRQEGFPIAVLEALGSRAPLVISQACHVDEVEAVGAGFVVPLEPSAIAAAIERVVTTPDPRSVFGTAGRALVETRYTWPRVADQALAMYAAVRATT